MIPPTTCRGCRCVVDPDDSVRVDWQFFTSNGSEYFCGACAASGKIEAFVTDFARTKSDRESEITITGALPRLRDWLEAR